MYLFVTQLSIICSLYGLFDTNFNFKAIVMTYCYFNNVTNNKVTVKFSNRLINSPKQLIITNLNVNITERK